MIGFPSFRDATLLTTLLCLLAPGPQTLREAAVSAGVMLGAAVRPSLFSEAAYSETLSREFNMVEAEDAMKWWVVRRNENGFDFHDGDEVARYAQAHGMKVRGHCLVWDHDNPAWLTNGRFTSVQLSQVMQEHIRKVMEHYAGIVFAWDVVNEALDEEGHFKDSIWYNQPGIGFAGQNSKYVEQAFRWAHETDPRALLFYNENGGEGLGKKSDAVYAMVKDFKARGVPIDGVGLQMHVSSLDFDTEALAKNISRLTALGLQVHITELDVSLPVDPSGQAEATYLRKQAEVYRRIVRACLQHPACTAIQTWGFTDKWSWIGSHSHGSQGAALLFDRFYKPKPGYEATLQELSRGRSQSQ